MMKIDILTIFPEMFKGPFDESMLKIAQDKGLAEINVINLRDFTEDKHKTTDDRPYGGGPGMLMKPEPIFKAVESLRKEQSKVILLTPAGVRFKQIRAKCLSKEKHLIFICGHYEGVDERVVESLIDESISIGDYVLTSGVLPAMVVVDSVVRLIPGVLGAGIAGTEDESFNDGKIEYPQYTRPFEYNGLKVPDVLVSGNHAQIKKWRDEKSLQKTLRLKESE